MKNRQYLSPAWMVGVLLVALVGCQPDQPVSTPPPSAPATSVEGTPSTSPTPTETPISSQEALYNEAEAVYRAYWKADIETAAGGGADTLPASVSPYVMGDYANALESLYRDQKASGLKERNTDAIVLRWVRPAENGFGALVSIEVCSDSTGMQWSDRETPWTNGGIIQVKYHFLRDDDGGLKIFRISVMSDGTCSS